MKNYLILLLVSAFAFAAKANPVFNKLNEINKYWSYQYDIKPGLLPDAMPAANIEQLQLHLSLVEKVLRSRSTARLTAAQQTNRQDALDHLHEYWQRGAFPVNDYLPIRNPVFIDRNDNFCAVGYLVKVTGYEHVSRMIASHTNFAYVHDMNYPQLFAWAEQFGFTVDELAWIQPGYPPDYHAAPVGKGTNGVIYELHGNDVAGKLFVGGSFSKIDGTIPADNIAYVTENNGLYDWHSMGTGVNGPVYAIAEFDNRVFVGGSFTFAGNKMAKGVACWDGNSWQGTAASCLDGLVKDLVVYHGKLYATGSFNAYSGAQSCFAQWTGVCWQAVAGLSGIVNTAEVYNDNLVLGGRFKHGNDSLSVIEWSDVSSFKLYTNNISAVVNDFEIYNGELFAACTRQAYSYDFIQKLTGSTWHRDTNSFYPYHSGGDFYSLLASDDTLLLGGSFYGEANKIYADYCVAIRPKKAPPIYMPVKNWFNVDTTIYKLTLFKDNIFAGGAFTSSICRKSNCDDAYAQFRIAKGFDSIATYTYNGSRPSWYNWPDSVKWYFGDGDSTVTTGFDSVVTHKYAKHGSYLVCAIAYNKCGADRMCDSVVIEEKPTGIAAFHSGNVRVYPNPTKASFTIENVKKGTTATISDMAGRYLAEIKLSSNIQQVDLSSYSPGIYILQLTHPDGTRQVVKVHKE